MAWRDQLRQASFRGIPFFVETSDAAFGRRVAIHEYPKRDIPYAEDLGRAQKEFTIEGYLLGDDYLAQRDALIAACEKPGRGNLIHPYYGSVFVVVSGKVRFRESTKEGGFVSFSIPFVEAGEKRFPAVRFDQVAQLVAGRDRLLESARNGFLSVYSVTGYPAYLLETAKSTLRSLSQTMTSIKGQSTSGLAEFLLGAKQIESDAASLAPDGEKTSQTITANISRADDISDDQSEVVVAYRVLANFGGENFGGRNLPQYSEGDQLEIPVIPASVAALGGTATREQERTNVLAIVNLVKQVAIGGMAVAASRQTYLTREDALSMRDELLDLIDYQMESTDDETYQVLHDVRSLVNSTLPPEGQNLPSLISVPVPQTSPSLVISYSLYGTIDRDEALVERNRIEHPGFVPGGSTLEVIRDA